jgi:hypothetical protein
LVQLSSKYLLRKITFTAQHTESVLDSTIAVHLLIASPMMQSVKLLRPLATFVPVNEGAIRVVISAVLSRLPSFVCLRAKV